MTTNPLAFCALTISTLPLMGRLRLLPPTGTVIVATAQAERSLPAARAPRVACPHLSAQNERNQFMALAGYGRANTVTCPPSVV